MDNNPVLKSKVIPIFFSYAIPVVLGLVSVSSAGIIDGIFIGSYIGEIALASASISGPIFALIFGFAILLSTGGEVFCGKYIGKKNYTKASDIFTKVVIILSFLSICFSFLGLLFVNELAYILGANATTHRMVVDYLSIIVGSTPLFTTYSLSYFVRVDGKPRLSSTALVLTAALNIILDYIFIVKLNWGIKGAAWGTVLSYIVIPIMLLPHFLLKKGNIRFQKPTKEINILKGIIFNGSSEFFSEISGGILFFIINVTMLKYHGTQGVAAYAVVGYLLFFASMIFYGISDSIKSLISINFGAMQTIRVKKFLQIAIFTVVGIGVMLIILAQIKSDTFVGLFLKDTTSHVGLLSNQFVLYISPILPLIGVNVILSAYLTAIHKAKSSLIISVCRTFILPLALVPTISIFLSGNGVILSLILSELITLIIAIILVK